MCKSSSGPSTVLVARSSTCEITWRRCEQPVVAVCGVVRVAATVLVFPAGTYRHYGGTLYPVCRPVEGVVTGMAWNIFPSLSYSEQ